MATQTGNTAISTLDNFKTQTMIPMDPKLQQAIILRRSGVRNLATVSTAENEIAVIAKVKDVQGWQQSTDVRGAVIIAASRDGQCQLVTGRIPISRIEAVRTQPSVISLKAARRLSPQLTHTVPAVDAPGLPPIPARFAGGKGVLVGIVDSGCDFAHRNFLVSGKTRIRKLWDQSNPSVLPSGLPGKIYDSADINKALTKPDPYTALGYRPEDKAHGTHVMDIAAGNGGGTGAGGVAPQADIIFVHVSANDIAWQGPDVIQQSFGDSVNLVEAIRFIFNEAGAQPCVINISLGTNGGPHDGSTLVEESIDSMLAEKPNRCVVIAASNSFEDGIHAMGNLAAGQSIDLPWIVIGNDITENEMEIWYPGAGQLTVEVIDPRGKSLGSVAPGESGTVKDSTGAIQLVASNRQNDPNNHDNNIGIWMKENQAGSWTVRLTNMGNQPTSFHAWIERDDFGQSSFGKAQNNSFTLGSISCSHHAITVASYDATVAASPISPFSSCGPTRDGRQKPEIAAPGSKVVAARSLTRTGNTVMSGTSMASPAVTGCIALFFSHALNASQSIDIVKLRGIIAKSGKSNPPASIWNDRYGNGRISVARMVAQLNLPPPAGAAAVRSPGASGRPGTKTSAKGRRAISGRKPAAKKPGPGKTAGGKGAAKKKGRR